MNQKKAPARNGRGCFLAIKTAEFAQGTVVLIADDDMVNQFELQKLTGPDQIARYLGVRSDGVASPLG